VVACISALIDVDALKALMDATTTAKSRGSDPQVAGVLRGDSGPVAGRSRGGEISVEQASMRVSDESSENTSEMHCSTPSRKRASYTQAAAASSLAAAGV